MVIFLALIFILNILLYKPILSIIDRRKKQLEESENEIKLFNESVEKRVAEYEEKLKQAKIKASELKKEIIQRRRRIRLKTLLMLCAMKYRNDAGISAKNG